MSDEKENIRLDVYMPSNYDNFGKLFGGTIEIRNAIETVIFCVPLFFIEKTLLLNKNPKLFIILFCITVLPLFFACLFGINGDSFLQFISYIIKYLKDNKEYRYKRINGSKHVVDKKDKEKKIKKSKKVKLKKN